MSKGSICQENKQLLENGSKMFSSSAARKEYEEKLEKLYKTVGQQVTIDRLKKVSVKLDVMGDGIKY